MIGRSRSAYMATGGKRSTPKTRRTWSSSPAIELPSSGWAARLRAAIRRSPWHQRAQSQAIPNSQATRAAAANARRTSASEVGGGLSMSRPSDRLSVSGVARLAGTGAMEDISLGSHSGMSTAGMFAGSTSGPGGAEGCNVTSTIPLACMAQASTGLASTQASATR